MVSAERILAAAKESGRPDRLSGLITPSLERWSTWPRDGAPGLHGAAPHRRGDDEPGPHRRAHRPRLPGTGRARSRRLARGRGGEPIEERGEARAFDAENRREQDRLRGSTSPDGRRALSCRWRRRGAGGRGSTGPPTSPRNRRSTASGISPTSRSATSCPTSTGRPSSRPGSCGDLSRIFENPDWGAKARELFDDAQAMLKTSWRAAG